MGQVVFHDPVHHHTITNSHKNVGCLAIYAIKFAYVKKKS